jgi:galactose mutarotase-like enzyme
MLGFHPAFRAHYGKLIYDSKEIYLDKFVGKDDTLKLEGVNTIIYENNKHTLEIRSNFGNFMLWSPRNCDSMFCIEPVTDLPGSAFKRYLLPKEKKKYSFEISFR